MPAVEITTDDLEPFGITADAKAEAMIDDALAMAALHAPCILSDDFPYPDQAKAIIRGAIVRWHEAGSGASQSLTALGFGQTFDTRQQRRTMFYPSEETQLKELCQSGGRNKAFEVDLTPENAGIRSPFDMSLWETPTPAWDWDTPP